MHQSQSSSSRMLTVIIFVVILFVMTGCGHKKEQEPKKEKPKYTACEAVQVKDAGWHCYVDEKDNHTYARYAVKVQNTSNDKTFRKAVLDIELKDTMGHPIDKFKADLPLLPPGQIFYFCGNSEIGENPITSVEAKAMYSEKAEESASSGKDVINSSQTKVKKIKFDASSNKITFKLSNAGNYIKKGLCSVIIIKDKKIFSGYLIPINDYTIEKKKHLVFDVPEKIPEKCSVEVYYADAL